MPDVHAKPGTGIRVQKSHAKAVLLAGETTSDIAMTEPPKPKCPPAIEWSKNPSWTDTLVTYLSKHTEFHIKLFSDLMAAAKKAGQLRLTAKDRQPQQ